jgi:hypothetical protein
MEEVAGSKFAAWKDFGTKKGKLSYRIMGIMFGIEIYYQEL